MCTLGREQVQANPNQPKGVNPASPKHQKDNKNRPTIALAHREIG